MLSFILAGLIFLVAGFIQGLVGFGAGLIAIPMLCLIVDVKLAVPLCILNGVILTAYMAYRLRSHMDRRKILPLLLGSIPGIVFGTLSLKHIDSGILRIFLGALLISYSVYNLAAKPRPLRPHVIWGYLAGFLTGGITAMVSAGGPPAIIYTTMTDWKIEEIKATLTGFFVFNAACTLIAHVMTGMTTMLTFRYFLLTVPFVLIGTALGNRLTDRIDRRTYLQFVYLFLLVMGGVMIWGTR